MRRDGMFAREEEIFTSIVWLKAQRKVEDVL